jgi:hypothetical protein
VKKQKPLLFHAPTEQGVHIALTSGHTAFVPGDTDVGTELDPMFHKEAIAKGCIPDGIPGRDVDMTPSPDRHALIIGALKTMLEEGSQDDFLPNGRPNKANVDAKLGFVTERHELDAAFAEVVKEVDEEDDPAAPADTTKTTKPAVKGRGKGGKK